MNNISTTEQVTFPQFRKNISAVIDTGATSSCIHADQISVKGNKVSFVNTDLSDGVISLPIEGSVSVKTADSDSVRPIVRLDIELGGQSFKGMQFNLNDRSDMDHRVLIGRDVLERGDFNIQVNEAEDKKKEKEPPVFKSSVDIKAVTQLVDNLSTLKARIEVLENDAKLILTSLKDS